MAAVCLTSSFPTILVPIIPRSPVLFRFSFDLWKREKNMPDRMQTMTAPETIDLWSIFSSQDVGQLPEILKELPM